MTTGRINQIAIFGCVCCLRVNTNRVEDRASSRKTRPARNGVRMIIHLEKSTFQTQRSQERLGCVKSESNALHKSATTRLLQLRLCIGCAIRSLLPCLGFPHRTSCLIPCYDPTHERRKDLERQQRRAGMENDLAMY